MELCGLPARWTEWITLLLSTSFHAGAHEWKAREEDMACTWTTVGRPSVVHVVRHRNGCHQPNDIDC